MTAAGAFDPLSGAEWIDTDQFFALFDASWERLKNSFLKIEAAPVFVENEDESFNAFLSGDISGAANLVQERVLKQRDMFTSARERGATITRLRVVGSPMTAYIRDYEMAAYAVLPSIGESIRFIDESSIPDELQRFYRDMLMFDDHTLLVHDYTPWGRLTGGWVCEDRAHVGQCRERWHELNSLARDSLDP